MTAAARSRRSGLRAGDPRTLLPGLLVLILVLGVASAARPHAATAISAGPLQWGANDTASNRLLHLTPSPLGAGIRVGPTNASASAAAVLGFEGIEEIGGQGAVLALAGGPSAAQPGWIPWNTSGPTGFAWQYNHTYAVERPTSPGRTWNGVVHVAFTSGTGPATATNVSMEVQVLGWPWVHATDSLVVLLGAAPADARTAAWENGSQGTLDLVAPSDRVPLATLSWPSTVRVGDSAGDRFVMPLAATVSVAGPNETLALAVVGGSGGYTDVDLAVALGLPTPASPTAPPVALVGLCIGWAVVVGSVAWIAVLRAWEPQDASGSD